MNFFLNQIGEELLQEVHEQREACGDGSAHAPDKGIKTWVQRIFEGTLTNETRCLTCETITSRDEAFLDLSLEIEENTSITSCLRNFSGIETLNKADKFYCDKCCSLQEAHKSIRIKRTPNILALHLKRFKYLEDVGRLKKLSHRVVFPAQLKLNNTTDDDDDATFSLFAVVVHVGSGRPLRCHNLSQQSVWLCAVQLFVCIQTVCLQSECLFAVALRVGSGMPRGPCHVAWSSLFACIRLSLHIFIGMNHGHYVSLVKIYEQWFLFDDDTVESIDESQLQTCFGSAQEGSGNYSGYILFYQKVTADGMFASPSRR